MSASKVLIVEDEPAIGELLCQLLEVYDFESRSALDGCEGLRQAQDWCPDAIVLDLMLPDVDGYEVCRALKADARTSDVAVLMLTAMQRPEDRAKGFKVGADRFLTKPFQPGEVVQELQSLMANRLTRSEGLRQEVTFYFVPESEFKLQVRLFLQGLLRASPLSPKEIEQTGATLLELGRNVSNWRQSHPSATVVLSAKILKDRLEYSFSMDAPGNGKADALRRLLGPTSEGPSASLADRLGCIAEKGPDSSEVNLVRYFA